MNYGTVNPYYGASAMNYYDPYLQHFGVKGQKWGQHIFGPLQSAWKYAMGENTLGFAKAAAARAKEASNLRKETDKISKYYLENKGKNKELDAARAEAIRKGVAQEKIARKASESYKRHAIESFKKGAIYRGASAVAGMASGAAKRVYGAAKTVRTFIKTAGTRALTGISNLASKFKQNIINARKKKAQKKAGTNTRKSYTATHVTKNTRGNELQSAGAARRRMTY